MFKPVASYRYLLPNMYLSVADIANQDFLGVVVGPGACQPSSGPNGRLAQITVNRPPLAVGGRGQYNLHMF